MTFVEPAKFSFLTFEHRVCHSFEGWMKTKIDAGAQNQNLDCVREKLPTLINARVDLSVILELEALRVLRLFTLRDVDLGDRGERDVAYLRRSPKHPVLPRPAPQSPARVSHRLSSPVAGSKPLHTCRDS